MSYLAQVYTELSLSKKRIYREYSCQENVINFVKHLENKKFTKEIFNNLHILYFYNQNNGYSYYGNISFSFHLNLLFFDKESSNWYIIDYDIENIIPDYPLDKPVLCSDFLQLAFCTQSAKFQISKAIEDNNFYPLQSFQQIIIFTLKEFKNLSQENSKLIDKINFISLESKRKEENFLWELYKDFNITFNNLYEFILFLEKKILRLVYYELTIKINPLKKFLQKALPTPSPA